MAVEIGDIAPDIEAIDHQGATWRLSEYRGRPVVLIFHRHLA